MRRQIQEPWLIVVGLEALEVIDGELTDTVGGVRGQLADPVDVEPGVDVATGDHRVVLEVGCRLCLRPIVPVLPHERRHVPRVREVGTGALSSDRRDLLGCWVAVGAARRGCVSTARSRARPEPGNTAGCES